MYQPSERTHGTSKNSQTATRQGAVAEGTTGVLENEQVYWEHPRHARKRPRLMEDVVQIDATNSSTPIIDANTSVVSVDRSSGNYPTPPSFALRMDTTMREASDMLSDVKTLKQETQRLEKVLQNNFRATSEEFRRLEARLELLEQSSHHIAQACQSERRQHVNATIESLQRLEDNVDPPKEGPKRLLQSATSSSALTDKWEILVQDPSMRSKVANLLDEIYDIVRVDLLGLTYSAEHARPVADETIMKENLTPSQPNRIGAELSSGASSRSMTQSPNSSRHTTPVAGSIFMEPKSPPPVYVRSPSATVVESASPEQTPLVKPVRVPTIITPISFPVNSLSTPVVETVSPEPMSPPAKHVQFPAKVIPKASSVISSSTLVVDSVSSRPKLPPVQHPHTSAKSIPKISSMKGPTLSNTRPIFIHPPFTVFPNSHLHPEGMSYDLMAANAEWFLDPLDFVSASSSSPNAIQYPRKLEPSTSMMLLGVTDGNSWPQDEERKLRCTFCRKTYSGEGAGRTWRNHVLEQHGIVLNADRYDNVCSQVRDTINVTPSDFQTSLFAGSSGSSSTIDFDASSLKHHKEPSS